MHMKIHTVEPVHKDHSRNQVTVVSVDRWSLYKDALVPLKWPMNQPTVVTVDRWSSYASGLEDQLVLVLLWTVYPYVCTVLEYTI